MKKSLIALALMGAFSGAAFAQSNVTLYGIVDVAVRWDETPTNVGTATAPRFQSESVTGIQAGHQSGNRLGVRGSEAIGSGLNAIFALEMGFNIDTGESSTYTTGVTATGTTSASKLFGRQAYAGLGGGWGQLVAGRMAAFSSGTGDFDMIGRVDPFATGFGLANAGNTFYSMNSLRVDNAIAYVTPTWGGFKGGVGYSFNLVGAEVPEVAGAENRDVIFAGAQWASGPFFAAITYDSINNPNPGASDQKHLQVGGTFDLAMIRFHAAYATQDDVSLIYAGGSGSFLSLPGTATFDSDSWLLGVTWTVTPAFKVFGSYQALDADGQTLGTGAARVNFEPDYSIWAIGATYNLSRRTNLYTSYASRDADGTLIGNNFNAKQFAVGIRHLF